VAGENPLQLDSPKPGMKVQDYMNLENRFRMLSKSHPDHAREYFKQAQADADARWESYRRLAAPVTAPPASSDPATPAAAPA
jgi:pyruvate-ferredoxin/flavodoxin oxidoreductase